MNSFIIHIGDDFYINCVSKVYDIYAAAMSTVILQNEHAAVLPWFDYESNSTITMVVESAIPCPYLINYLIKSLDISSVVHYALLDVKNEENAYVFEFNSENDYIKFLIWANGQ